MKTITYLENKSGYCEIISSFNEKLQHTSSWWNIIAIADNSCAFAAFSLMKDTFQPLTIEFKIIFITKQCQKLIAKGIVLRVEN